MNRRCKYYCTVEDAEGVPSFTIRVEDVEHKEQLVFRGKTPRGNCKSACSHVVVRGILCHLCFLSFRCVATDSRSYFEHEEGGRTRQLVSTVHHWRGK